MPPGPQQVQVCAKCCRAPEPTDIWWENLSVRGRQAWHLRLQSAAITVAVVAVGGVVQYFLAQAGEGERSRRLTYEVCRRSISNLELYKCHSQMKVRSNPHKLCRNCMTMQSKQDAYIV